MRDSHRQFFELLGIIALVGALGSAVFAGVNIARHRAQDSERAIHIAKLRRAFELYASDRGTYPIAADPICLRGDDPVSLALRDAGFLTASVADPAEPDVLPTPDTQQPHCYIYESGDGTSYSIRYWDADDGTQVAKP